MGVKWARIMRKNLFPIPGRLLVGGTIRIRRIPIVNLTSRRRLVLLSRVRLIVINVRQHRFISIGSLWSYPLRVPSIVLLRIHSLIHPIATTIRLPTFLRGVPTSAVVTTKILTIRPALTLSMPRTTCIMILFFALIRDVLPRWSTSIVTLPILIMPLRPLILLLVPAIVPLVLILPILTILTRMTWLLTLHAPHLGGIPTRLYLRWRTRLLVSNH